MTPLEWVGAIVAVLIFLALALLALGYLLEKASEVWQRVVNRAVDQKMREMGNRIANTSYWWETIEQRALWKTCGETLARGEWLEAGTVRDQTYPQMLADLKLRSVDSAAE